MTPSTQPPLPDATARTLDLAGEWRLAFAPGTPVDEHAQQPVTTFTDRIVLPATTETAGLGPLNTESRTTGLTPVRRIEGPVWYEREFEVPAVWGACRVLLHLERTKHAALWLDGRPLGAQSLLCTPHKHDLGPLAPGPHRLTLCVDNSRRPVPGDNHQLSEHTQGNWNGVLGRLALHAVDSIRIAHVEVVPDVRGQSFALKIHLAGPPQPPTSGTLTIAAASCNHPGPPHAPAPLRIPLTAGASDGVVAARLPLGPAARPWDEFSPALYRLTVTLDSPAGRDARTLTTGLREFRTRGSQFTINGRTTFLRGEVNCCVFPLTGHPPMEVAGWLRYYRTLQAYGINHVRFHSWTPPDAAFTAADELGIFVQTELPFWGEWNDTIRRALLPEGEAILRTYGHHPSFVLLTLGNEHRGERAAMSALVAELRALDPSRLYAEGANNFLTAPTLAPGDDFWITARVPDPPRPGRFANVRGGHATPDGADGHLQTGPGGTRADYAAAIAGIQIPVVSHEIGQYAVAPNFAEIARYTGVFAARNLEHFRAKAAAAGLLAQAEAAHRASGKLAALLYREEIEAALRTPGFGGFQLLGLQDFPGQGTALVGLLDAFLESKGAITPENFRRFCARHTLLARFDRHTWTGGEAFTADLALAHYGPADLPAGALAWSLVAAEDAAPLAHGEFAVPAAAQGGPRPLGELRFTLPSVSSAQYLELRLTCPAEATTISATYPLWLYPERSPTNSSTLGGAASSMPFPRLGVDGAPPSTIPNPDSRLHFARSFDSAAQAALAVGARVLLMPDSGHPFAHSTGGGFTTDFWCWPMFHNTPGTMGLLIQPDHPVLSGFPTATHSDWQWFHLARAAQPVVLDSLPQALLPVVQVIDNLERCHRLGLLFEARVGPGRLLVCALDLPTLAANHPEARQLLASLAAYVASDRFQPAVDVEPPALAAVLASASPSGSGISAY